jgi:hypothetical protein
MAHFGHTLYLEFHPWRWRLAFRRHERPTDWTCLVGPLHLMFIKTHRYPGQWWW